MTDDELRDRLVRLLAAHLDTNAAMLKMCAAVTRATLAFRSLARVGREIEDRQEQELFGHPDLMDLDMHDAAWRPES